MEPSVGLAGGDFTVRIITMEMVCFRNFSPSLSLSLGKLKLRQIKKIVLKHNYRRRSLVLHSKKQCHVIKNLLTSLARDYTKDYCLTRTGNYKIHEFDWLK